MRRSYDNAFRREQAAHTRERILEAMIDQLGRGLQVQLTSPLEVIDVGDHDLGQVDLQQVDLLPQDQRQEQIEGTCEHVEVQLEVREFHSADVSGAIGLAQAELGGATFHIVL